MRATTIEDWNALPPTLCFAKSYGLYEIDGQNTRDQKLQTFTRTLSDCVRWIVLSFLMEGQLKLYMQRMRNRNLEIKIAGSSCRPKD